MAGVGSFLTSSAASGFIGYLTKGIGSKIITYIVVIFMWTQLLNFVASYLPVFGLDTAFNGLPGAILWGLNYVDAGFLLSGVLSAQSVALLIRLRKG